MANGSESDLRGVFKISLLVAVLYLRGGAAAWRAVLPAACIALLYLGARRLLLDNALLDFKRRVARCLRVYHDLDIGDVWHRVDGEPREVPDSQTRNEGYDG